MKEENINKLNSLFSRIKTEEEKLKESLERKKSEEELFLESFKTLCKNIIEPKMQEFRSMLLQNGFGCKVEFREESNSRPGIHSHPNIRLQISRNVNSNFYANDKFPHVMFTADRNLKRIGIHVDTIFQNGTGNSALKPDFYTLETLDENATEREIVESLEKILVNR